MSIAVALNQTGIRPSRRRHRRPDPSRPHPDPDTRWPSSAGAPAEEDVGPARVGGNRYGL